MKNFFIFFYFFISFIINKVISNEIVPLISSKLIENEYATLGGNCTITYLLEFPYSSSIANITSVIYDYNPIKVTVGKNLNKDHSILVSNILLPIDSQQFKLTIIDSLITSYDCNIQLELKCSILPTLVSPINKNPNSNNWIMTKSRLLNQQPTLTIYMSNLNGFIGQNTSNTDRFNFKSSMIFYKNFQQFDPKVLLINYYYSIATSKIGNFIWSYSDNDFIVAESISFTSPISSETINPPDNIGLITYPSLPYIKNFKIIFQIFNSSVLNSTILGFVANSDGTKDAMNVYPIYGNPSNAQFIVYINNFNDYKYNISTWGLYTYHSSTCDLKTLISRGVDTIPVPVSNVKSCQLSYYATDSYYFPIFSFINDAQSPVTNIGLGPFIKLDRVSYPYGFSKGNAKNYTYKINTVVPLYFNTESYYFICPDSVGLMASSEYKGDISTPIISSVLFIPKDDGLKTIVRINASDSSFGIFYMETFPSSIRIIGSDLVSGDRFNGVYEKLIDFSIYPQITSIVAYNTYNLKSYTFIVENLYPSKTPSIVDITTFRFASPLVNLSIDGFMNTIYMNYSDANINYRPGFKLITTAEIARDFEWNHNYDFLQWDNTLQLFKLDFYMPPRLFTGNLEYRFNFGYYDLDPNSLSNLLVNKSINNNNPILSVVSDYADEMPPIVTNIVKYFQSNTISIDLVWEITFSDQINGVESINITVKSDFDLIGETFTYFPTPPNNKIFTYRVKKTIVLNAKSQTYTISEIVTRDTSGHYANSTLEPSHQNILNPWRLTYDNITQFDLVIKNSINVEENFPTIGQFKLSKPSNNQTVIVQFTVNDDSGISNNLPIIYFTTRMNQVFSVVANSKSCSSNVCSFENTISLPFLFGYPEPISVSIYRIEDVYFNFNGYPATSLSDSFITTFTIEDTTPTIESTSSITDSGGNLILYGHWFGIDESAITIMIRYIDIPNENITSSGFIYQAGNEIKFSQIKKTKGQSIFIQLKVGEKLSNEFELKPIPTIDCPNNCNEGQNQGICQSDGTCKCLDGKWFGIDCSFPYHFISSVLPSTTKGGEASFIGSFGNIHNEISLLISGTNCPITFNSSSLIKCSAPPGTGTKNVTLTQNLLTFTGYNIYKYIEISTSLPCPNKCSNNGICNTTTGFCICNSGFGLFDCSALVNTDNGGGSNTTIDTGTGSINLTNSQTNFQISIKSLIEIDIYGGVVKSYSLLNNWTFNKTENELEPNKYILKQQIINNNSSSPGGSTNSSCIVTSIIEEIKEKNGKEFTFAGSTFIAPSGSIKFTISISNYTYQSNLNSLKLDLVSLTDGDNVESTTDCNSKQTEIDTSNVNDLTTFNYIKISKNNRILEGRFINKVISDGRSTFFTTTTRNNSNSIITTLNLPHCVSECIIDPDFSVLISNDYKFKCDSENSRKWFLPVVITVPIVGCMLIIIFGVILYKKSTTIKVIVLGSKLNKIGVKKN
ncbi:hypothetical protein RB653_010408 [Dictyostelium firmibasis]|uniref:EGF-like domain-containing protein n=1 Tax=Dictyostelium firmibasis TaxID=79012 RepID=A0AAN7YTM2_9MYCE